MESLKKIPWAKEPVLEEVPCPVCQSKDFRFFLKAENLHLDPALFTRKGYQPYPLDSSETHVVQCRGCGLAQVNPRRAHEDLLGLNNALHLVKDYKDDTVESGEVLTGEGDREIREARIRKVMQFKQSGRWLDVGCGAGRDLDLAVEKGFEGFGVEVSEVKKDFYRDKKYKVHIGRFEEAPFPECSFDVITLWDVLEHVENPNEVIAKAQKLLKDDGIFVAKVPNHAALNRRVNGAWWDMYHPLHLYYFTLSSLRRLLENHSLTVVHAYSINPYGMGCFLKDTRRHWKRDRYDTPKISASTNASSGSVTAAAGPGLAKTLWRLIDWAPKQISLKLLAGNFLIVIARKK